MGYLKVFRTIKKIKSIDPNIFASTVRLVDIKKWLFLSKFMGMVSSVSVIFDNGDTYSCLLN